MNYTEHKITLDIHKAVSQVAISVKKGDTGRRLAIELMQKGYPYHLTKDCYAVFTAKKPDGHVVFNNCFITGCTIYYDVTEQTVAAVGIAQCEIILYGADGKQLTSASFQMIIEDTVYDTEDEIESSDEFNALRDLVTKVLRVQANGPVAPAILAQEEGTVINLTEASDFPIQAMRIFGKSTQAAEPSPENPVEIVNLGTGGSIKAKVLGKNIGSGFEYSSTNKDYGTLVKSTDTKAVKTGRVYTISVTLTATADTKAYWNGSAGIFTESEQIAVSAGTKRYSKTFTAAADGDMGTSRILVSKASTGDGVGIAPSNCQIELGAVATGYEITEQFAVLLTPGGLPGIPVSNGGNYIDSKGQRWICDEIDLARGVRIQRIDRIKLSTLTAWGRGSGNGWANASAFYSTGALSKAVVVDGYETKANILCDRLVVGLPSKIAGQTVNRVGQGTGTSLFVSIAGIETTADLIAYFDENETTVQYVLATPIETALTEGEITAFAALHSYKGNTTIYTDVGAHMATEYVVDTKTYIDRRSSSGGGSGGGSAVSIGTVTILAANWKGDSAPYSQVVAVAGVTEYSQVDLNPSVEQLAIFHNKDLAFVTENDGGVVTVYAIGDKPQNDYTIQATITEVNV